jgi:hypothetical protein
MLNTTVPMFAQNIEKGKKELKVGAREPHYFPWHAYVIKFQGKIYGSLVQYCSGICDLI